MTSEAETTGHGSAICVTSTDGRSRW